MNTPQISKPVSAFVKIGDEVVPNPEWSDCLYEVVYKEVEGTTYPYLPRFRDLASAQYWMDFHKNDMGDMVGFKPVTERREVVMP